MKSDFFNLMHSSASWLADEIYLHPSATTLQKSYEVESQKKIISQHKDKFDSNKKFLKFLPNIMNGGFGQPKINHLAHLSRLTFPYSGAGAVLGNDLFVISQSLNRQLTHGKTYVAVSLNPYSKKLHIDLLYAQENLNYKHLSVFYINTARWLMRLVEAQILHKLRAIPVPQGIPQGSKERILNNLRPTIRNEIVTSSHQVFSCFFTDILKFLIPENHTGCFSEVLPTNNHKNVSYRLKLEDGSVFDNITEPLNKMISENKRGLDNDRIHELNLLKRMLNRSRANYIFTTFEKFIIRDSQGQDFDDWDGIILEVFPEKVVVKILEAKNVSPLSARENQAFKQLEDTQKFLKLKNRLEMRRRRISGMGASLTISLI